VGSESIWILNLPRKFAENEGCGERFVGNVGPPQGWFHPMRATSRSSGLPSAILRFLVV